MTIDSRQAGSRLNELAERGSRVLFRENSRLPSEVSAMHAVDLGIGTQSLDMRVKKS